MEFNFSTNNSMTEFETLDTSSTIYLGFASQPETNIFSQKYFRSPHASTTESLIKKLELLETPQINESQVMIHLVQGWPTLDGSTAYYVQVAATAFDDSSSNSYAGISDATTLNCTTADIGAPTLSSSVPTDGATGIGVNANIVLNFDEAVDA